MNTSAHDVDPVLGRIERLLGKGEAGAAEAAARALIVAGPGNLHAHVLLGHALRLQARRDEALDIAELAVSLAPEHPAPRMLVIDLLHEQGARDACVDALHALAAECGAHPIRVLQDVAQRYTMLGLHAEAESCQARARARKPGQPAIIYNHATALIALGRLGEAEIALDEVIERTPGDGDAWYNRSTLRKQTPARNHVAGIEVQLQRTPKDAPARVALNHALAKELEDLGEHARSFTALRQGADARRRALSYRVEDDIDTMRLIERAFDRAFFARTQVGHEDARPLFIVGLPRSGTTLVDRILSSHSAIASRGETSDLAMALVHGVGKAAGKAELVEHATRMDFAAMGARYCAHLPPGPQLRQIDKTPINFLYLGLICAALPNARIIHLRRDPMDGCYAIYKTLFRMAYPFSYDLGDLGRYWLAYDRLMKHWRQLVPAERLLEIDYEELVAQQEVQSRRLLSFAGLSWESACLHFDRNTTPSLTASAAQVRQPMYRSSVGLWRRYATELAPLRDMFEASGMRIDDARQETAS